MKASKCYWVFGAIFLFIQPANSLRILAIFPVATHSHFTPFVQLGKALALKGYQIDVYSHFPLKSSVPNYKDYSLEGTLPQDTNNLSYQLTLSLKSASMREKQQFIGEVICSLLDLPIFQTLIKNPPQDPPYDLIINEVFFQNCFIGFKRLLNIPMVGIKTCSLFESMYSALGLPYNPAVDTRFSTGSEHLMSFYERLKNIIVYYTEVTLDKYYTSAYQDPVIKKHFGPDYPGAVDILKDLDLLLVNSHHSLEGIRSLTPNVIQVAGLHIDQKDQMILPKVVPQWLDDSQEGFIYVSFGSMVRIETFPNTTLHALYATFRKINPVRVLLKISKFEDLPPGLPMNVLTQTWMSQIHVLKHRNIRAFVTHGGMLGTIESILYGVPMIGIPLFGDQPSNIKEYVRKGLATMLEVEEITDQSLTNAVEQVLYNSDYKKNVMKLSRKLTDTPLTPIDTAIFWIEYIARHGKNALKPPIFDMSWWQACLLDVYGFMLLIVILVYYIVKFAFRESLSLIQSDKKIKQTMQLKKKQ